MKESQLDHLPTPAGGRGVEPNMLDYDETRRGFGIDVPEYFNFGFDVVDRRAEDRTKLALIAVDEAGRRAERLTFWDVKTLSNKFANALKRAGAEKGDRLFLMLPRIPQWHSVMVGAIKLGVVPMPATTLLTPRDVEYRVGRAEARIAVTDVENAFKVEACRERCPTLQTLMVVGGEREGWLSYEEEVRKACGRLSPAEASKTRSDDPGIIWFTSGTEGPPKMALHPQSYFLCHLITAKFWMDLKPTDLHWTLSDTGWAKAAWGYFSGQWLMGTALFQHSAKGRFNPKLTLDLLERYGVTTFCAPPTAWRLMVREELDKYDFSGLRHCVSAGEPLNPEVIKIWREKTGLTIYDGYGQTESVNMVANYRCLPVKPGSMGKPTPGWHVSIVDEQGNELPSGREGNIAVKVTPNRPPGLFREYWKDPEGTAAKFRRGWYYTGDRAYRDEDGYFWFVARADDVIKSAAYRIGPFEVESALLEHPAVLEAAVVGRPDSTRGSVVKAYVVLRPGNEPSEELVEELQEHVKRVTAPYKYPREVEFVGELPKTISGKIRRVELRESERKGS